jgi:large subunit ribosomal protein L24e
VENPSALPDRVARGKGAAPRAGAPRTRWVVDLRPRGRGGGGGRHRCLACGGKAGARWRKGGEGGRASPVPPPFPFPQGPHLHRRLRQAVRARARVWRARVWCVCVCSCPTPLTQSFLPPSPTPPLLSPIQVFKFCRPKCHKAFQKKKNPRKIRWTKAFRKSHGKEMKVDSSLEFERRRNVPVKYDRDLVGATLQAMKRVGEIKEAREKRFWAKRMAGKKTAEKRLHALEVAQNLHLMAPAVARKTEETHRLAVDRIVKERVAGKGAAAAAGGKAGRGKAGGGKAAGAGGAAMEEEG